MEIYSILNVIVAIADSIESRDFKQEKFDEISTVKELWTVTLDNKKYETKFYKVIIIEKWVN